MNEIETTLNSVTDWLQKLDGAPAIMLVMLGCLVLGYLLKCFKRFPNDGIPMVVIMFGGVVYPFIADSNNDITLRVWLIRNAMIGLVVGFVSWLLHNKVLSRIEDRFFNSTPPITPDPKGS